MIPVNGLRPLAINRIAPSGIKITYPTSLIKLEIVAKKTNKKVIFLLSSFTIWRLINVSNKPVACATLTPNNATNNVLSGVKLMKLRAALLIIYFNPS